MPENENGSDISYSMTPHTGPWTKAEAAHLLRRTMFGPTNQQILDAVSDGMSTTVANLLQIPAIGLPLTYHPSETVASQGAPWNMSVFPTDPVEANNVNLARIGSLIGCGPNIITDMTPNIIPTIKEIPKELLNPAEGVP